MRKGDRIRVTEWFYDGESTFNENIVNPPPLEGTIESLVRNGNGVGQMAWVKFDSGPRLCVLDVDTWEVLPADDEHDPLSGNPDLEQEATYRSIT